MTNTIDITLIALSDEARMDVSLCDDLISEWYTHADHGALLDALGLCNDAIATLGKLKRTIEGIK